MKSTRARRAVALTGVVCMTTLLAAACSTASSSSGSAGSSPGGSAGGQGKSVQIAAINGDLADPFFVTLECGADAAAKQYGATITWRNLLNLTDNSAASQAVSALLVANPQGFLDGVAYNTESVVPTILNAKIPLVEMNLLSSDTGYYQGFTSPVQPDAQLQQVAQLIAGNAGDSGDVAILGGDAGLAVTEDRWQPVVTELKAIAPHLTVLPTQYDGLNQSTAASVAAALLVAHPDLKAIYAVSGPEGTGAISAVAGAHKQGKVAIYTYDATPPLVSALKAGTVKALVAQSPYNMGLLAAKSLIERVKAGSAGSSGPASPQNVVVPLMVLTQSNISTAAAQPYLYKASCS
jgi:ribose transport system substrate-binding protein